LNEQAVEHDLCSLFTITAAFAATATCWSALSILLYAKKHSFVVVNICNCCVLIVDGIPDAEIIHFSVGKAKHKKSLHQLDMTKVFSC